MVMDLWGERAAGPMHSLHFAFGVGAMIAPQIAKPFLSSDQASRITPYDIAAQKLTYFGLYDICFGSILSSCFISGYHKLAQKHFVEWSLT